MPVSARYRHAAASDPGRKRGNNEDRYLADAERGIFAVVDGMGGAAAGEHAAQIAIEMLSARLGRPTGTAADRLREAIAVANNAILEAGQKNPEWQGMACVLTAAVVEDRRVTVGHVGDSRLYLLRAGEIRKITHDHSPVGEREDAGELTEREAMRHPRRNEVYRDVGSEPHRPGDANFVEIAEVSFPADAALLLCSDGLSDLVPSAEIRKTVESHAADPNAAVEALIASANAAGGKDNITAVLVTGSEYAHAAPPAVPLHAEAIPPYLSRWAFLVYGLVIATVLLLGAREVRERMHPSPPVKAGPRTWTVGPTETTDGATISGVLEKAQPGDTVTVAPGEYRELVRLREGVTLTSLVPHGAVLHATDQGTAVLAEGVRNGVLSGFRVAGDAQHPLAVGVDLKDSSPRIERLEISGASTAGVAMSGESAPVLEWNQIVHNPGAGIVLRDRAAPRLLHNLVADNGKAPRNARPGLEIRGEARADLVGNTFLDNGAEAIWATRAPEGKALEGNFFGSAEKGTAKRRLRVISR